MSQLLFFADPLELLNLSPGESPRNAFACMHGRGIDGPARAQLYSIVSGSFLQDALEMEISVDELSTDSSWINGLTDELVDCLGQLDESAISETVAHWQQCEEIETLDVTQDDLLEYLFALVNLCQNALQEDARVFTYTVV